MIRHRLRHRVERTKNKHSRAVFRDNTIIIRLAKNLSRAEENEHVKDLLKRMTQQILLEKRRIVIDPFRTLLLGEPTQTITLASGKSHVFSLYPDSRTRAVQIARGWEVAVGPSTGRKALHQLLWRCISKSEKDRITELVHRINEETFNVRISEVRLRFASSQWGSCSSRGVIMLNAALLFVPPSILRYVIIHELAHRKRADHSPTYWSHVESVMPNYERIKETLADYRLPTL